MFKQLSIEMQCPHCLGIVKANETFVVFGEIDHATHVACYLCQQDLTDVPMHERPCNIRLKALQEKRRKK
jgi:hypothetical protein